MAATQVLTTLDAPENSWPIQGVGRSAVLWQTLSCGLIVSATMSWLQLSVAVILDFKF